MKVVKENNVRSIREKKDWEVRRDKENALLSASEGELNALRDKIAAYIYDKYIVNLGPDLAAKIANTDPSKYTDTSELTYNPAWCLKPGQNGGLFEEQDRLKKKLSTAIADTLLEGIVNRRSN